MKALLTISATLAMLALGAGDLARGQASARASAETGNVDNGKQLYGKYGCFVGSLQTQYLMPHLSVTFAPHEA
jgi:hypothetical protein